MAAKKSPTKARAPKEQTGNRSVVKGADVKPPTKPKADDVAEPTLADLASQVATLTELVTGLVSEPQEASEKPAPSKGGKKRQPKAEDTKWAKGTIFTYVKKDGSESTFRITKVHGKKADVRNQGTDWTSNFKLTTLDALLRSENIKDVR